MKFKDNKLADGAAAIIPTNNDGLVLVDRVPKFVQQ